MPHDHHETGSELDAMTARVMALETLLTEKGLVDPAAIDAHRRDLRDSGSGRATAPQVVARAWTDPGFAAWLRTDATAAIASLGFGGRQGEHMRAVFNTPERAQPRRLHALLLLPVERARAAAGLVQGAGLPLAGGASTRAGCWRSSA